jgi:hypothetical protein
MRSLALAVLALALPACSQLPARPPASHGPSGAHDTEPRYADPCEQVEAEIEAALAILAETMRRISRARGEPIGEADLQDLVEEMRASVRHGAPPGERPEQRRARLEQQRDLFLWVINDNESSAEAHVAGYEATRVNLDTLRSAVNAGAD